MNVIQIGLGEFGFSWFENILLPHDQIKIGGLVDQNSDLLNKAKQLVTEKDLLLFTSIREALAAVRPDFILNVTPPNIHKEVNVIACEEGIPVLCEKPIAESYEDAMEILQKVHETKVPIMIAENYRFTSLMRTTKKIISSGEIGKLNSIQIDFQRNHTMTNYHKDLKHPLLLDVTIHHIDSVRYLTGVEAQSIFARAWTPSWSWYRGYSNADLILEMEDDIKVSYRGSLAAFKNETGWFANWRIEGEKGIITICDHQISVDTNDTMTMIEIKDTADSRKEVLDEFIEALQQGRIAATDITDNMKTFQIVHAGIESIAKNERIVIKKGVTSR